MRGCWHTLRRYVGFDQQFLSVLSLIGSSLTLAGMFIFRRFMDTALESPLGQTAMIPMLAWIANSAPRELKATFFAVMASFTNLALSLRQLGTKYLNEIFTVTRQVRNTAGAVAVPADYSELGLLLIAVAVIGMLLPLALIILVKLTPLQGVGDANGT